VAGVGDVAAGIGIGRRKVGRGTSYSIGVCFSRVLGFWLLLKVLRIFVAKQTVNMSYTLTTFSLLVLS
jgi:hypothetical protein